MQTLITNWSTCNLTSNRYFQTRRWITSRMDSKQHRYFNPLNWSLNNILTRANFLMTMKSKARIHTWRAKCATTTLRTRFSVARTTNVDTTRRKCAWAATIGLAEQRKRGLAHTPTSFITRRDYARTATLPSTTVSGRKRKGRKSWSMQKKHRMARSKSLVALLRRESIKLISTSQSLRLLKIPQVQNKTASSSLQKRL